MPFDVYTAMGALVRAEAQRTKAPATLAPAALAKAAPVPPAAPSAPAAHLAAGPAHRPGALPAAVRRLAALFG